MKIRGESIPKPKSVLIVIPREDQEDIALTFEPVMDWSEFDALQPEPPYPVEKIPGKGTKKVTDENSPAYKDYLKKLDYYSQQQTCYNIIKGLSATEGLEWETVNIKDPSTWKNYDKELQQHFTKNEYAVILNEIMLAGFPTEERRKEARSLFMLKQAEKGRIFTSPQGERNSTPSGEPANA